MKQKNKTVTRKVDYLSNARPLFVSLVDHGANQEPFKILKKAKGESKMSKKTTTKKRLKLVRNSSTNDKPASVRKLTFDKKNFPDKASVKKYLEENNWEDYTIVSKGTVYEASGAEVTDEDFESVRKVSMKEKGVTGYVGILTKAAAEDAEDVTEDDDEPADDEEATDTEDEAGDDETDGDDEEESEAKSAEQDHVVKYDYWSAMVSRGDNVDQVMKDGMSDGVPPGFYEIMDATRIAVANVCSDSEKPMKQKKAAFADIGASFANIVYEVAKTYDGLLGTKEEKRSENIKKFIDKVAGEIKTSTGTKKSADEGSGSAEDTLKTILEKLNDIAVTSNEAKETAEAAKKLAEKRVVSRKSVTVDANTPDAEGDSKKAANDAEAKADAEFAARCRANRMGIPYLPA